MWSSPNYLIMETKGLKLLRNVKTRWISMLNLTKRVIAKYMIKLLVKMGLDMPTNFQVVTNLADLDFCCHITCLVNFVLLKSSKLINDHLVMKRLEMHFDSWT